jgi:hypothetical protein
MAWAAAAQGRSEGVVRSPSSGRQLIVSASTICPAAVIQVRSRYGTSMPADVMEGDRRRHPRPAARAPSTGLSVRRPAHDRGCQDLGVCLRPGDPRPPRRAHRAQPSLRRRQGSPQVGHVKQTMLERPPGWWPPACGGSGGFLGFREVVDLLAALGGTDPGRFGVVVACVLGRGELFAGLLRVGSVRLRHRGRRG